MPSCRITDDLTSDTVTLGYVCCLDSPRLPKTVKECLDNLARGLCVIVKSEVYEATRLEAMSLISNLASEIIKNSDDNTYILKRLVSTNILQTCYKVMHGTLYSEKMYNASRDTVELIRESITRKMADAKETMVNILESLEEPDELISDRTSSFVAIAELYTDESIFVREVEESHAQLCDTTDCCSLVDTILNYELISEKISDCY